MIAACSGMASPIRNRPWIRLSRPLCAPRTIAYAAIRASRTVGIVVPSATTTLLRK